MFARFLRRFKYILSRKRSESELDREIRFHLDIETQARLEDGMTPADAHHRTRADFGSVDACKQNVRDAWGLRLWHDFTRDVRYAFSTMRRRPAFAFLTVLTLAVGIGATTAVFTILDRAVLRPLPYRDPERLVYLTESRANQDFATMELSYPNLADWKTRNRSFED